jgi:hypothetical protein
MKRIPIILFLALTIVLAPFGPAVRGQLRAVAWLAAMKIRQRIWAYS